ALLVFAPDIASSLHKRFLDANSHLISAATAQVDATIKGAADELTTQTGRVKSLSAQEIALRQNQIDSSANDPQLQQVLQEITNLGARKSKAEDELQAAETRASNEQGGIRGDGTSGNPGRGPRYRAILDQVQNARTRLNE